jgi:ribosomal protein S6
MTFDASPATLKAVDRILRSDEAVIRFYLHRKTSTVDKINSNNFKNAFAKLQPGMKHLQC